MRVAVVGAGLGGLSAACHLAGRGHDVTVFERSGAPGGCAGALQLGGYVFDTGPTVLTMPSLLEEAFEAAGTSMAAHLELLPLDPMYRACFADGSTIYLRRGVGAMAEEVREKCGPKDAQGFVSFTKWLQSLYQAEMGPFIARNYNSPFDLFRPVAPLLALARLRAFRRMSSVVSSFIADERLRRLFSFQAMYAGLSPHEALAIYCVITYMDTVAGVYFPKGGMSSLGPALAAAASKAGAQFCMGTPVEKICLASGDRGPVRGVFLPGGEFFPADAVVCNVGLPTAYRALLPGLKPPRATRTGRYSPSAVVWHVGVRGSLPVGAAHHNIHFGSEWERALNCVIREKKLMADPSFLVSVPSTDEPSMAPAGGHCLYVLEPVPNLDGAIDWPAERDKVRGRLVRLVGEAGYPMDVQAEALVDPTDWAQSGLERGTPFTLAHTFFQSGPFRPSNVDPRAPGLVFSGSGTVPGVGVPMVLVSGRLAADRVEALVQ